MRRAVDVLKRRWLALSMVAAIAVVAGLAPGLWERQADASAFLTAKAERGSVAVSVSATGTVQAVTTVQVGSQTSGAVAWLGADFNSEVKQGQVIARLDPSTLEAQVQNARAQVASAEAAVEGAQNEIANQTASLEASKANAEIARLQRDDALAVADRYTQLKNVVSARDIEAARTEANVAAGRVAQANAQVAQAQAAGSSSRARLEQARAQLAQARAQLDQALVNLDRTVITSPIDGTVVSRSVDVGQTVAASLQAPTLFTIANDLTKMRVLASVDEADVGQVRQGVTATFSVDAFPGDTFTGTVSQIRLDAQAAQNVVTYTAVIDFANPDLKLRPGMTANITFPVDTREDVLTVPNAALRFRPATGAAGASAGGGSDSSSRRREPRPAGSGQESRGDRKLVYVLGEGGVLDRREVRTGLTDGRVTEIVAGELAENEIVVTGQTGADDAAATQKASGSPFGAQRTGGMPGRRGR